MSLDAQTETIDMTGFERMSVYILRCARCGGDHPIAFELLSNPADDWMWWGMCPNRNQPVLMKATVYAPSIDDD